MKYWNDCIRITHGCRKIGEGCLNCWTETEANIRQHNPLVAGRYCGLISPDGRWTGRVTVHPENIDKPRHKILPRVWQVWNDLFIDEVNDEIIARFAHMAEETQRHTYCVLTKRMERAASTRMFWPENVYIGFSVSTQKEADKACEYFGNMHTNNFFLSWEPAVERVDFSEIFDSTTCLGIIAGGETGPGARRCDPEWFSGAAALCADSAATFFFKGIGDFGGKKNLRKLDGKEYNELPW